MFSFRSLQKELLDEEEIPKLDLYQNLKELNTINTLLGGHSVTLKGIKKFNLNKNKTYKVLDIGCGGGDNLRVIANWARTKNITLELIGVDLKTDCIEYATTQCEKYPEISFIQSDYKDLINQEFEFDIAFACLFNHHLTDEENKQFFDWCSTYAKVGFFINDLHRHPFAYYSIKWLTTFFSKSYLVKNDASLSVLRGFKKNELQNLLSNIITPNPSSLTPKSLKWVWAFRWLYIYKKARNE